jgi:KDO2-lipid IV(A) lauroyltransferase
MTRHRISHVVEYGALRSIAALLNALPYRGALTIAWALAALSHWVFGFRRKEALRRIRIVMGSGISGSDARRIAWHSWRNVVFSAVELLRERRMTREWICSVADCGEAMEALGRHAATGKGAILACPHMGNWELAAVACHLHGIPIFSIAAPQKNPLTDNYINRLRRAPGIETFARGSGLLKQVIHKLRAGGFLAILPDVRVRTEGVAVPFLGGTANLGAGMARLARHCGVPVYPAFSVRIGWTRHQMRLLEPVHPDLSLQAEEDIARMTAQVVSVIEKAIREHPAQWFWYNKRWVLDPLEPKAGAVDAVPPAVTGNGPADPSRAGA